ncbi:MAG TPA: trypsin-like serine protease [Frankiaceae bacterium]|jgi:V8-like Glu-specific endopeptidase|nr:trypsin-like serine protease [Frankiaceae bacterium]
MSRGAALGLVAIVAAACTQTSPPTAFPVGSVPTTGPLIFGSTGFHGCTASVVSSPTQNLLITAAHCLSGTGRGITFVPGSVNGSAPYGTWTVVAAYADQAWLTTRNPLDDMAILKVAPDQIFGVSLNVQRVTGGNTLITTPATLGEVQIPAYAAGVGGYPFSCLATAHRTGAYTTFDCGGYVGGTSGAPFLQGSNVLGVIGGLHQGGCLPATSYSSPFTAATLALLNRAASGAAGDTLPAPGSDGC